MDLINFWGNKLITVRKKVENMLISCGSLEPKEQA